MSSKYIKYRRANKDRLAFNLDMTAILDVFLLLLIFFAYHFHSSGLMTGVASSIQVPTSDSTVLAAKAISIQVSKSQIWVDNKEVLNTTTMEMDALFDKEKTKIVPLYNHLMKVKANFNNLQELSQKALPFDGKVNLVIDKTLKYNYLKRIINTCSEAGFKDMRFIVSNDLK